MSRIKLLFKSKFSLPVICFVLLTLTSCDPAQVIRIENKTDKMASITFIFEPGTREYRFHGDTTADTLKLELEASQNNDIREYYFAMGSWEIQSSFDSLVATVKRVETETWKSKEIYEGEQQISTFFKSRISNKHREVIEINLN